MVMVINFTYKTSRLLDGTTQSKCIISIYIINKIVYCLFLHCQLQIEDINLTELIQFPINNDMFISFTDYFCRNTFR